MSQLWNLNFARLVLSANIRATDIDILCVFRAFVLAAFSSVLQFFEVATMISTKCKMFRAIAVIASRRSFREHPGGAGEHVFFARSF